MMCNAQTMQLVAVKCTLRIHAVSWSLINPNLTILDLCVHEATKRFREQQIHCSRGSCRNYFLGCLNILERTTLHRTHRSLFGGFLGVRRMLLQLMNTLCTMQYLISVGFFQRPWKKRRSASLAQRWPHFHVVKKNQLKLVLREQLITSVLLIYFTVINPVRPWWPQR